MPLEFGTDGVRGIAGSELTGAFVRTLGRAAARVLGRDGWYLGRDTRRSGPELANALGAGLRSEGARVTDVGVLPTPALAFLSQRDQVPAAMISASHNPYTDNGVKLFAAGGRKLADDVESRLEAEIALLVDVPHTTDTETVPGTDTGMIPGGSERSAADRYTEHLVDSVDGRRLSGLRIVLDCAHGAASAVAPSIFRGLGAEVTALHAQPDGTNINANCGSTHPADLQRAVREERAHAGLAFDGDADRVLAVDHTGALVDGDHVLAICALDLHERGALVNDTVVATVMTNLGFRLAMAERGIAVLETNVGDRYVLEALEQHHLVLGGEQSGHIIFRNLATTGDGILTGLQLLDVVLRSERPLRELAASSMSRVPQVLRNVRVADRGRLAGASGLWDAVAAAQDDLGARGRVLLRPSGTEPFVRVMVEAPTEAEAAATAERLCAAVTEALGPPAEEV